MDAFSSSWPCEKYWNWTSFDGLPDSSKKSTPFQNSLRMDSGLEVDMSNLSISVFNPEDTRVMTSSPKKPLKRKKILLTTTKWTCLEAEIDSWNAKLEMLVSVRNQGQSVNLSSSQTFALIDLLTRAKMEFRKRAEQGLDLCAFCRNNKYSEEVYKSHKLKDSYGKVACPYLRRLTCPHCGQTGDRAHTIKYCPFRSGFD